MMKSNISKMGSDNLVFKSKGITLKSSFKSLKKQTNNISKIHLNIIIEILNLNKNTFELLRLNQAPSTICQLSEINS